MSEPVMKFRIALTLSVSPLNLVSRVFHYPISIPSIPHNHCLFSNAVIRIAHANKNVKCHNVNSKYSTNLFISQQRRNRRKLVASSTFD